MNIRPAANSAAGVSWFPTPNEPALDQGTGVRVLEEEAAMGCYEVRLVQK
jgi:hypothetical protein